MNDQSLFRQDLLSELAHWSLAADRLTHLDDIAATADWAALERETGVVIRAALNKAVTALTADARTAKAVVESNDLKTADRAVRAFRHRYLQTETTLDFFADAIGTRTSEHIGALLRATDTLAEQSMTRLLAPLGFSTPPVLTYIDKGLGASILKAGLRLWDRRLVNPIATIKVVRHNILRPTALLHESGHQVAHIVGWNEELRDRLNTRLPGLVGETWSAWSSEIAADAFAFVNAGYAAVAALRNVVDGGQRMVFRFLPGDPHPIAYLRVLLGIEMCRLAFGAGPWDDLALTWRARYPLRSAPSDLGRFLALSERALVRVAAMTLNSKYTAFKQRALSDLIDVQSVSPAALDRFEQRAGTDPFESPQVAKKHGIRLLALSGYRFATQPRSGKTFMQRQLTAMRLLGQARAA